MLTRRYAMAMTLVLLCATTQAQQPNPLIGTWKTNPAKSKVVLGGAAISQTARYETAGTGLRYTSDRVAADGSKSRIGFTAFLDGSNAPYKGVAGRDAIKIKKIDSHTYEVFYLNGGQVVQINFWIVSPDGRTLTTVSTGVSSENKVYSRLVVADKQ